MNRNRCLLLLALSVLGLQAQTPANLALGDIAVAGGVADIAIMDGQSAATNLFTTPVGLTTMLWDPNAPDTLIAGSGSPSATGGYITRTIFTGGGQQYSTLLVPAGSLGRPAQLSWDQTGRNLIVASDVADQVFSVDPQTGEVTRITTGAQPWGSQLSAGIMDPVTGDLYVGTSTGDVWRLASGTGGITLFQSGLGSIQKILIDDGISPQYLYVATTNSFHRVELGAPGVVEDYFGAPGLPSFGNLRGVSFDNVGAFVLVNSQDQVWRMANPATIPSTGVAPVLLGGVPYPTPSGAPTDVAVIGAATQPFRLVLESVPVLGADIRIENLPQGLELGFLLLSAATFLPEDTGPVFGLYPDALTLNILGTAPVPCGLLAFNGTGPAPLTLPSFTMAPFYAQTWDGVAVAFGLGGRFLGRSNLVRVTW